MRVELVEATPADEGRLANLLQLYLYDWSELLEQAPGDDGRFAHDSLARWWAEPERHPFLLRADGRLAGFALARRGSLVSGDPSVMDMAEFLVVRGLRRRGVGLAAAALAFARFPGPWEVRVMERNRAARPFWERAVAAAARGGVSESAWTGGSGNPFAVFGFTSGAPAGRGQPMR